MRCKPPVLMPALLIAVLMPGCSASNPRAARDELLAVDTKFSRDVAEKGLEVYEQYFAEDAVSMPAFEPMVEGKTAILDTYRPYYRDPRFKLTWQPMRAEVSRDGTLGFTIGRYQVTHVDDQGKPITRTGKYVTVWRREWDGTWKVVLDGGSPDERPAPAGESAPDGASGDHAAPPAASGAR
jgi:ketosteroid isomerase-like protein